MNKLNILSNVFIIYGNFIYYTSLLIYKICNFIIEYTPDNIIPNFICKSPYKNIKINNIQYCKISKEGDFTVKDITNKANFLLNTFLLKNSDSDNKISFILGDFIKYIGNCAIIYIDYQITNKKEDGNINTTHDNNVEKTSSEFTENKNEYEGENENINSSFTDDNTGELKNENLINIVNSSYFNRDKDNKFIKKIIDVRNSKHYEYIDENNKKTKIPFGEIIF